MFTDRVFIVKPRLVESVYSTELVKDWTNPTLVAVDAPVSVQPVTSDEPWTGIRSSVETRWRLVTAPGHTIDVGADARLRVDGIDADLEVDGRPAQWGAPLPHTEINLKLYEG
ncbi:hypothetical protein [uncultured Corynebacterium sp.]|uniref:hypothetical protein n=1 Tax=uncultured Corynebacterium sp. TaxID=159447 RepID=UPI00288C1C8C|nr:hypothetical protein [uncultured Corynebacterium sp.]